MKIKIKSFNKNPKKHIKFFKDRGFLVLENVLSQRDFKDINKLSFIIYECQKTISHK